MSGPPEVQTNAWGVTHSPIVCVCVHVCVCWARRSRRGVEQLLDAVLEAEQLPARIAGLHAALAHVDRDNLTHI